MYQKSCCEFMHTQAYNNTPNKANMEKISYTSSDHGFIRLVRQGDNPNKKPSYIYIIPLSPQAEFIQFEMPSQ